MNSLSTQQDLSTEALYSALASEIDESRVDFATDFSSFSLSLSSGNVLEKHALLTTAASSTSTSSPAPAGASAYTYTWAKGVKTSNNKITSGYFDANKTASEVTDGNLCWAATASNMIGWWQKYYGVTSRIGTSVPTSASAIFSRFKQYWQNKGGKTHCGLAWWIAGDSTHYEFDDFYSSTIKSAYRNKSTGGYYKSLYTASDANGLSYFKHIQGESVTEVASTFNTLLRQGCAVGISLGYDYNSRYGYFEGSHAVTLWGITRNSSGRLTAIHVTDSDDRTTGVVTYSVSYNSSIGAYRITSGYLKNNYLVQYNALKAFDRKNYSCPASLKVSRSGQKVTFRWTNRSSGSNITHQLAYKRNGASKYTYVTTSASSKTVTLTSEGKYVWSVRTMVGTSFTSDWKKGSFSFYGIPPKITLSKPSPKKSSKNKSKVTFYWKVNERSTLALYVDNKRLYLAKNALAMRRTYTLKDGKHSYKLIATDSHGNKSYKSGTFLCDTIAPGKASGLSTKVGTSGITFSWKAAYDKNNVTYTLAYRKAGSSKYTYVTGIKGLSYTLELEQGYTYNWAVRAVDGNKNNGAYAYGKNVTGPVSDTTPPSITLATPTQEKQSTGSSKVAFSWSSNEKATFVLTLNGEQVYQGTSSSYTLPYTLSDGTYSYTVTATDAAGNTHSETMSFDCDTTAPAKPTSSWISNIWIGEDGVKHFILNWSATTDPSGVTYIVDYRLSSMTEDATLGEYTNNYAAVKTDSSGTLVWWVKAVDGKGNAAGWFKGEVVYLDSLLPTDTTPPTITLNTPQQTKASEGKTTVTFSWTSNEAATYVLKIFNAEIYKGSNTSYTHTSQLEDGNYTYTLIATDAANNTVTYTGTFTCDATAPTSPATPKAQVSSSTGKVQLSWTASSDDSTLYYQVAFKTTSEADYRFTNSITSTTYTLNLSEAATWVWFVRAYDKYSNKTEWVRGENFTTTSAATGAALGDSSDSTSAPKEPATLSSLDLGDKDDETAAVPPAQLATTSLDQELALSAGSISLSATGISSALGYDACTSLLETQELLDKKRHAALAAAV